MQFNDEPTEISNNREKEIEKIFTDIVSEIPQSIWSIIPWLAKTDISDKECGDIANEVEDEIYNHKEEIESNGRDNYIKWPRQRK